MHCRSIGSNAHTQGTPTAPSWGRGTVGAPFQSRLLADHLSRFPRGCRARARLPTGTAPMHTRTRQQWTYPNTEWATTCVLFTYPSQIPGPKPIHKHHVECGLLPGHADAQPWPYVFLSWGYHLVVLCGSLCTQRGAGTLVNSWAVTFISLLKPRGQRQKSLWLLSMQTKIMVANNEKLNGYHWSKPKCYNMDSLASQYFLSWATFFSNHWYLSEKRYSYCIWVFQIIE